MRRLNRRTSLPAIGLLGALGSACGGADTPHRAGATPIIACVGPLGLGFVVNSQLDVVSITPGTLPTTMGLAVGDRIMAILGAPVATAQRRHNVSFAIRLGRQRERPPSLLSCAKDERSTSCCTLLRRHGPAASWGQERSIPKGAR